MNDDVIDLTKYMARTLDEPESDESDGSGAPGESGEAAESGGAGTRFSVWGGDGPRSRFALPIWRSIYLVGGSRGALVWEAEGQAEPRAFFVLDLACEPPRTHFIPTKVKAADLGDAPRMFEEADRVAVYLGSRNGRNWFLVLDDRGTDPDPVVAGPREDLLFLAGECAGLLFFREFAEAGEDLGSKK